MSFINLASGLSVTLQSPSTIASIVPGSPYTINTSAAHGLNNGDLVQLSCFGASIFTVTVTNSKQFTLNETTNGSVIYTPASGTVSHIGHATAGVATDKSQIYQGDDFTIQWTINTLTNTGSYVRAEFEDSATGTFLDALPGPTFCSPSGPITSGQGSSYSTTYASWPALRCEGASGEQMRVKVFIAGPAGTVANFSAELSV